MMLADSIDRSREVIQTYAVSVVTAQINNGFTLVDVAMAGFMMALTQLTAIDYRTMLLPD